MLMLNFSWHMGFFSCVSHVYFEEVWKMSSKTPMALARQEIFQLFASVCGRCFAAKSKHEF